MKKKLLILPTLLLLFIFSSSVFAIETAIPKFADPYGSSWQHFNTKTDVPADKVWTIDFSRGFSSNEISAITVQCDDVFVPVKITQISDDKITVTPVENYLPGRTYCLKIILENGKKYFMNFSPSTNATYSRLNPAPLSEWQEVAKDGIKYKTRITKFYRGEDAFNKMIELTRFNANKPALDGYEYILIKAETIYSQEHSSDDTVSIDPGDFSIYTQNYERYTGPTPAYLGDEIKYYKVFYDNGYCEGYLHFMVKKDDKYPVIQYDPIYSNKVWFQGWIK